MELTKFDFTVLISMTVAVIVMSFVFPAVGVSNASANASEIPELNITTDRFDLVDELPERATTPSQGSLDRNSSEQPIFNDNQVWLEGVSGETQINRVSLSTTQKNNTTIRVRITVFNSTGVVSTHDSLFDANRSVGQRNSTSFADANGGDWIVTYQLDRLFETNATANEYAWTVGYKVRQRPGSNDGFLGTVPVVGTVLDGTDELAQILGWIGSVIWFYALSLFEVGLNAINVLVAVTVFGFELLAFLASTYTAVVAQASGWALLFTAIPGLVLSIEFAKIGAIGISLLPLT